MTFTLMPSSVSLSLLPCQRHFWSYQVSSLASGHMEQLICRSLVYIIQELCVNLVQRSDELMSFYQFL